MKRFVMLASLLLVGCSDRVTLTGIEEAIRLCEPHGGLSSVQPHKQAFSDSYPFARCNNGLVLDLMDTKNIPERRVRE